MNAGHNTKTKIAGLWRKYGRATVTALAFFGITGAGLFQVSEQIAQRALLIVISGPIAARSRLDSIRTAQMIRDTVRAAVGPLRGEMVGEFNQIKTYLIRVPEVRRQVTVAERAKIQAERDSLDLIRAFPIFHPH